MIDLRSDTVTKPTPGMLAAMMAAEVGDDVFGEDPAVNELERRTAAMFGLEAGVFVPTGTMANQIAVRVHCKPQDEVLLESTSHIYVWEAGGVAALSGATCRTIDGRNGLLTVADFEGKIRSAYDLHVVRTRLVCLENTHNRGGGTVYSPDAVGAISHWARQNGLSMHLDGARIWNAMVRTGVPASKWAEMFDTVAVCFSKGLGAPVGSMLLGPRDLIAHARRIRKLFGGAMRQAGYLAAACQYALDHIDRLAEDHENAQIIAKAVAEVPGFKLTPPEVETNLVWFEVDARHGTAKQVAERLKVDGVRVAPLGPTAVRVVTHLGVTRDECIRAADEIRKLAL